MVLLEHGLQKKAALRDDGLHEEIPSDAFDRLRRSLKVNSILAKTMGMAEDLRPLKRRGEDSGGETVAHLVADTQAGANAILSRSIVEILRLKTDGGETVLDRIKATRPRRSTNTSDTKVSLGA